MAHVCFTLCGSALWLTLPCLLIFVPNLYTHAEQTDNGEIQNWGSRVPQCVITWLENFWDDLPRELKHAWKDMGVRRQSWIDMDMPEDLPLWDSMNSSIRDKFDICQSGKWCEENETKPVKSWNCFVTEMRNRRLQRESDSARRWQMALRDRQGVLDLGLTAPRGIKELVIGVKQEEPHSCLLAGVAGRLLTDAWKVNVQYQKVTDDSMAETMISTRKIDIMIGVRDMNIQSEVIKKFRDLHETATKRLFITIPSNNSKYSEAVGDKDQVYGRFWTDLFSESLMKTVAAADCDMGPWTKEDSNSKGYGVWCYERRQRVPLIFTTGPMTPNSGVNELMVFLKTMKLPYGILFTKRDKFERRMYLMTQVGRPTIMVVEQPSMLALSVQSHLRQVVMPYHQEAGCGQLGTWEKLGTWSCGFLTKRLTTLGQFDVPSFLSDLLEDFDISNADMSGMLIAYHERYFQTGDHVGALNDAIERWVDSHHDTWRPWFKSVVLNFQTYKALVLVIAVSGLAAVLCMELISGKDARYPDMVDRSEPLECFREVLAGVMDTINVLLRAVGIATLICNSEDLLPYQDIVLKHVLVGHFVSQLITVYSSNMETPILGPSMEVLPAIKLVEQYIFKHLVGQDSQAVVVSLIYFSSCASLISGFVLYMIGRGKLGSMLRYMPYAAEISVQGAIGIVLFDLGVEAACDMGILEVKSIAALFEFCDKIWLWIPAVVSAAGLILFTKHIYDSHYTTVVFMALAAGSFHSIRMYLDVSCEAAAQNGFLFPATRGGSLLRLYKLDTMMIYWPTLIENLPLLGVCLLVIVVINCGCQLAVAQALLPPKTNGISDFDHEMTVQGRAHICCGLFGGFPSDYGNDDALVHRMFGGKYRLGVWVHIVTVGLVLTWSLIAQVTLPYIPKFINATIILLAAIEFVTASLIHARHDLSKREYCIVCLAAAVVVCSGGRMELGLLLGIALGSLDFVIKYTVDTLARMPCLKRLEGHNIATAGLLGYLFFANATPIVDELLAWSPDAGAQIPCAIVIDWAGVTGLDAKAAHEFRRLAVESGRTVFIYCGVPQNVAEALMFSDAIAKEGGNERSDIPMEVEMHDMCVSSFCDAGLPLIADVGSRQRNQQALKVFIMQANGEPLTTAVMMPENTIRDLCAASERALPGERCIMAHNGEILTSSDTVGEAGLREGSQVTAVIIMDLETQRAQEAIPPIQPQRIEAAEEECGDNDANCLQMNSRASASVTGFSTGLTPSPGMARRLSPPSWETEGAGPGVVVGASDRSARQVDSAEDNAAEDCDSPMRHPLLCRSVSEGVELAERLLGEQPSGTKEREAATFQYKAIDRLSGVGRVPSSLARPRSFMVRAQTAPMMEKG